MLTSFGRLVCTEALDAIVQAQDSAASTMFVYHLGALGYEAWDFKHQEDRDLDPCVSKIYEMVCYTYFPKNQAGCKSGSQIPYLKPCKTPCEKYLEACQVECCDNSATCVFELTSDLGGGEVSTVTGYVDQKSPSAVCTGHSASSASSRAGAPLQLLLALFGLQLARLGSDMPKASESDCQRGTGPRNWILLSVLAGCAVSLQGCSLAVPTHSRANWRSKPDYLIKYEHVPPGQPPSTAILNSCTPGAAAREVCSGHGQCMPWSHSPLKLAAPGESIVNLGVAFCECDSGWADPECRTQRKSQLKAFFLSLFGGFFGLGLVNCCRKGMSFDEKKATLLSAMQAEASFFTLKELETLGKSKGAVKEVVESLVAEDEVQSDKVGSQVLFWALPSHRTAMLQKKRQKFEVEIKQLQAELQKCQADGRACCDGPQALGGLGSRERLGRCNSAPVTAQAKARWISRAEPTGQARDRHLRSQPIWVPPSLRMNEGCRPSTQPQPVQADSRVFFAKPPFVFAEPQPAVLFQLKQSLLLDEGVTEATPRILGSTPCEREKLGPVEEDQAPPSLRPEMPIRLKRQDMAPKSRARYSTAFFQAARHDGLHRDKSPHADLTLGSVGRSFVQTVAGGGRNEIMLMFCVCILYGMLVVYCAKAMQQRVCTQIPDHRREYSCLRGLLKKLPMGALTYYSVETCSEWRMPKRGEYKTPKSRRPLEGLGGRVKPGVCLQLAKPPTTSFADSLRSVGDGVANVYRSLMAKISPETLPKTLAGLNVLVLHDRNERKRVSKDEMTPPETHSSEFGREDDILLEANRYMRMSSAAYGRVTLRPGPGVAVTEQNFVQLLCKHTGLNPEKVSVPHASMRAGWLLPAHYVLLDRERREAVVTVRGTGEGTLSVADVLTDLGAEEAHKNMLQSACNVLRVIGPVLRDLSGEVDTVTFAGHSLGGGVAAYMTMLFLEIVEGHTLPVTVLPAAFECQATGDTQKKYSCRLRVRCFSFGAPGICSAAVSKSLRDRVASFCHAEDVVPRLSTGHLLELHGRAVLAASGAGDLVKRLLERAQAGRDSGGLLKAAQAAAEAIPQGFEKALQMSTAEAMGSTCSKSMESIDMLKLYPAGRCFLLQTDGEVEELEPEALAPRIDLSGGLDRFYLGFPISGLIKLVTLGGLGTWWLYDVVRIGSAPVYAKDFRVSNDLAHWVFVLIAVLLFTGVGIVYSLYSYGGYRKLKRAEAEKTHGDLDVSMDRSEGMQGARLRPAAFGYSGYGSTIS
eukprot:s3079_g9.t1